MKNTNQAHLLIFDSLRTLNWGLIINISFCDYNIILNLQNMSDIEKFPCDTKFQCYFKHYVKKLNKN